MTWAVLAFYCGTVAAMIWILLGWTVGLPVGVALLLGFAVAVVVRGKVGE